MNNKNDVDLFEKTDSSYVVRYVLEMAMVHKKMNDYLYEQDIDIARKNVSDQINDEVQIGNIKRVYYHRKIWTYRDVVITKTKEAKPMCMNT